MKRIVFLTVLLAFLLSACKVPTGSGPAQTAKPGSGQPSSPCGDGVCSGPENANNCPADCGAAPAQGGGSASTPATQVTGLRGDAPLYMTTMTHMEGPWNDDRDEGLFLRHVEQLRYGMDLADEYAAILSIESEQPFARANTLWNLITWATQRQVYEAHVA